MSIESIVKQAAFEHIVQQGREQALADLLAADPAFAPAPSVDEAIAAVDELHESEPSEADPTKDSSTNSQTELSPNSSEESQTEASPSEATTSVGSADQPTTESEAPNAA